MILDADLHPDPDLSQNLTNVPYPKVYHPKNFTNIHPQLFEYLMYKNALSLNAGKVKKN